MAEGKAPIIVTAELGAADQAWANALRRRFYPSEHNKVPAHVTLFRHLPPSLEGELRSLLARLAEGPKPSATITGAYSLGQGTALQIESPSLLAIWDELAARFERHLMPQDRHRPRLHITVQNKVPFQVAREALAEMRATLTPRPVTIAALACWHYRGGPWSPIARYAFRRPA